jgi:superfamily II DNA or RNA helicase
VREQIVEEVGSLKTLRQAEALGIDFPAPKVFNAKKRITTPEEWEELREYDVIVGTVQSVSPAYESIPEPPADLFDLVLVDEAHHTPARTWQAILDHFAKAKRLLFTATPFRQDQREIKGRFIFSYDLRQAYRDGIFGQIAYQPVSPGEGENNDVAIARAAQQRLVQDRDAGYVHRLMVRTDSRKRAAELLGLYQQHTNLRLKLVTGEKSLKYAKEVIDELRAGALDGIVCVNMLGEGFNFPNLKIEAIHSPHHSLAVTLQFIGRLAAIASSRVTCRRLSGFLMRPLQQTLILSLSPYSPDCGSRVFLWN